MKSREFEFSIRPGYHLTLEEISQESHDRTPHAGNLSKTGGAVVEATRGSFLIYTRNQVGDKTYHPSQIRFKNSQFPIGQANNPEKQITAFAQTSPELAKEISLTLNLPELKEAQTLSQIHIEAVREAYKDNEVQPFDWLFTTPNGEEVLRAMATIPGAFDRELQSNGVMEKIRPPLSVDPRRAFLTHQSIAKASELGYPPKIVPGPVLSNVANIVAHPFARHLDELRENRGIEIHLVHSSGPKMIRYTQKENFQNQALIIAEELARRLGIDHVRLEVLIYPASELTIATPGTDQTKEAFRTLSAFIDLVLANHGEGEEKNRALIEACRTHNLSLDPEGKIVKQAKRIMKDLLGRLSVQLAEIDNLNFKPREFTQYDVLTTGRRPIIPDALLSLNTRMIRLFTQTTQLIAQGKINSIPRSFSVLENYYD